ncbi:hypothetical protein HYC85_026158 [Camellia sinensis]|uniref:Uncharacterized protein n=1 Tax=Camellia sinensis TaxID=4442 RepID=A0A7J7G2W7_CAMSI|nr:hypothetical protein HYC85_026158 [Camellia sinensis]
MVCGYNSLESVKGRATEDYVISRRAIDEEEKEREALGEEEEFLRESGFLSLISRDRTDSKLEQHPSVKGLRALTWSCFATGGLPRGSMEEKGVLQCVGGDRMGNCCSSCFLTNIIVMAMLLLGGSAVNECTHWSEHLRCKFFNPTWRNCLHTCRGLKATFLASYIHSVIVHVVLVVFVYLVYTSSSKLGSPSIVYHRLLEVPSKSRVCQEPLTHNGQSCGPVSGNYKGSYLTMLSSGALVFGIINIVGNFVPFLLTMMDVPRHGSLHWLSRSSHSFHASMRKANAIGAILGTTIGCILGIITWSSVASVEYGRVNLDRTGRNAPMLAGNLVSILTCGAIHAVCIYTSSSKLGSPSIVYHRLLEVPSKSRVCQEPLTHNGQSCGPVSAIVARPSSTHKGYLLGGLVWFAVLFSLATSLGLRALALDLPITANEASHGLVPPAIAIALMGKGAVSEFWTFTFTTSDNFPMQI